MYLITCAELAASYVFSLNLVFTELIRLHQLLREAKIVRCHVRSVGVAAYHRPHTRSWRCTTFFV